MDEEFKVRENFPEIN